MILLQMELITSTDVVRNLCKKMAPPLVTLLSAEPEIQYVALRNINLIVQKRPTILAHEIKVIEMMFSLVQSYTLFSEMIIFIIKVNSQMLLSLPLCHKGVLLQIQRSYLCEDGKVGNHDKAWFRQEY